MLHFSMNQAVFPKKNRIFIKCKSVRIHSPSLAFVRSVVGRLFGRGRSVVARFVGRLLGRGRAVVTPSLLVSRFWLPHAPSLRAPASLRVTSRALFARSPLAPRSLTRPPHALLPRSSLLTRPPPSRTRARSKYDIFMEKCEIYMKMEF